MQLTIKNPSFPHQKLLKPTMVIYSLAVILALSHGTAIKHDDSVNYHFLPGLLDETYSQTGDIDIGAIMIIRDQSSSHPAEACSSAYIEIPGAVEITEAVAFAVDFVNRSPYLLPNVTLGFVIKSTCYGLGVNVGTSLSFLPRTHKVCNGTTCSLQRYDASVSCPSNQLNTSSICEYLSHDVIGVLPPPLSSYTIPVSTLYAVAQLPSIGYVVTSDDLSDKSKHPYFLRIIPPDTYQVKAILNFISANGWSYISVIYEDDSYGIGAYGKMQQYSGEYGICIGSDHRIFSFTDYDDVVSDLLLDSRARVVVVFVGTSVFKAILGTVINKNASGHFIWIGADSLHSYAGYDHGVVEDEPAVGTFLLDLYSSQIPAFNDHLKHLKVSTTRNPWVKDVWEILLNCSYERGTCASDANVFQTGHFQTGKDAPLTVDAVLTFAHAAHNLLAQRCPDARGEKARACITGELLLDYLKNTTFDGFNGRVAFDENQDVKGKYVINQFVYDYYDSPFSSGKTSGRKKLLHWKRVGLFDLSSETITYFNDTSISWSPFRNLDRIVPWSYASSSQPLEIPESVCSRPCLVGEYKIEKRLSCCWECRKCRDNERLVNGNTSCQACPSFTWPDPASDLTTCSDIPLTFSTLDDTIPIVLTSLAILALLITVIIFIAYIIYRDERVIKASSRELSVIQLLAIFTGYTTIILFQIKPDDVMCSVIYFLFCMSFVLLYGPLLVKTIRIFRIFKSGTKNEKPSFISPQTQLLFANSLIAVQVIACVANYIFFLPGAHRTQPIWSEKLVELSCDLTLTGLASFLGYNIVLVSLCSVFAFKVRKLPDNFNESKFISMCVSATLLIWLAFIPTYFTADREYVRVFLQSTALLLNHSVALIFLFVPKIYAAVFVPSESGTFSSNRA